MSTIRKKLEEFNKRWNISDEQNYAQEFSKFKVRIINIFEDIDIHVNDEDIKLFCKILGIKEVWHSSPYSFGGHWSKNIINALKNEDNEREFYRLLQIIFYLPIKSSYKNRGYEYGKNLLFKETKEALNLSNVNLTITMQGDDVIFYPKGEKEFDEKLVNQVLIFLNDESQRHFIDALKFYETGDPNNAIKSAEELRRSLEEFLRHKLRNKLGLDKNISELIKKLKADKRDPVIRNIIFKTFDYLDKYFNENSKHRDGDINSAENEFLIYQMGILIRYIEANLKN